jgi:hypothetical protein
MITTHAPTRLQKSEPHGTDLRTEANAYLTKQLKQIDIRLNTEGRIITIVPHAAINALQMLYQSRILEERIPESGRLFWKGYIPRKRTESACPLKDFRRFFRVEILLPTIFVNFTRDS